VLIWAAIRFGPRGATAATFALSVIAICGTVTGVGPFANGNLGMRLFALQSFMAVAAVTTLLLAASLAERWTALKAQAREELLAVVAHDLKDPLNAIKLGTTLLLRQELDGRCRKQIEAIERSAGRMGVLVTRLLDEASLRMGGLQLKRAPEDLVALVNEVAEMMRLSMSEKSETLRIEVPPEAPVTVDRERILQVLCNLFGNAVKFTPENGTITARVQTERGWARCVISDSGPGVHAEQLPYVFEPYWTGDPARGNGLGLSIAREIVEAHGGKIWFRSEPGTGTTVGFSVPLA
jgi:signal transduction histidine kinase